MDVKLVIFKSDGERKDLPLTKDRVTIGRGKECDFRIPLASVSREHCEIRVSSNMVTVKDLGSSNGIYVNKERVESEELSAGDRLVVGPVVFTVQIDGEPSEIKPVTLKKAAPAQTESAGAAEGKEEEVVDLEADVLSHLTASDTSEDSAIRSVEEVANDSDMMAAFEALSEEEQENEEQEED